MNNHTSRKRRNSGEGNARSCKRKRKHHENGGSCENDSNPPRSSSTTRYPKPLSLLRGKLFAVSTLVEASSEESPEAYSSIVSLCKDLGAQTTGQVHKRVDAVIATESAVHGNTQRVRKAWKKGIPVVDPSWIRSCMEEGRLVDMRRYLQQKVQAKNPTSQPKDADPDVSREGNSVPLETDQTRMVDLGCCCVCHENASGPTDCAWCVECSVNQRLAQTYDSQIIKPLEKEEAVTVDLGCCCVCHDDTDGQTDCAWCVDCSVNKSFRD